MASRNRTENVGIAPPDEPVRANYDRDVYSWSQEQARALRDGKWSEVDRENVAEEIESLGRTEFNKLESALRLLLIHMLKWDHQPSKRSRSCSLSIKEPRLEIEDLLADNPGLKPRVDEAIARAYRRARVLAAKETKLAEKRFPAECPYSWKDIVAREFTR